MPNLSDNLKNNYPFESSKIVSISSNYNANSGDTIFVNTASSAINVTLPTSPNPGSKVKVLDVGANSQNNNITVLGNGVNIGGASAYVINTPDSSIEAVYISSIKGWNVLNEYISITKPLTPSSVTAVDVGTNRAYNDGAASVSFIPSSDGDPASSYTAISTPGNFTATATSSPIIVPGLLSNTAYTFKVRANNAAGSSSLSTESNSITATTVPQAPTITSVTSSFENLIVAYTGGQTGGKAVSAYTATRTGGVSVSGSSPITFSSLSGISYTITMVATNANGNSATSNSITETPFTASGGTITTYSNYRAHTFDSTSTFTTTGSKTCEIFVLAGGGGGGSGRSDSGGPGGGAGGMQTSSNLITGGSYTVTIGGGGGNNTNGSNSVIQLPSGASITSVGGGGGYGKAGGSGAGGDIGGAGGLATSGQGSNGGAGRGFGQGGAGGGGKGGVGSGSNGGGSATNDYRTGSAESYAGGGGGGDGNNSPAGGGLGGNGGGATAGNGSGSGRTPSNTGGSASANTGSAGGGGLNYGSPQSGGNGGSGRIIVRYTV